MENLKQNICGKLLQNVRLQGAEIAKLEILREQGRAAFAEIGLPSPKTEANIPACAKLPTMTLL